MHGRVQRGSKRCRSLGRSCSQHMRSILQFGTTDHTVVLAGDNRTHVDSSTTTSISTGSFIKDGREFSVGDSALFKPPRDSPPFIGLIRWLSLDKENILQLGVNWLYRPSELKLGKGALLGSAPNEIFYSFQKDKVPAASLLHPCKVAFLPRGVELPTGTPPSFICRRAYDIANKCLWWLTDQQFIDDQQVEVNKLFHKTRVEMHGLQPRDRSPKPNTGPTSTSQLKPGSDNCQNSCSAPSQARGKKRERGDHGSDTVKRERFTLPVDGDSVQFQIENNLKREIAKITEKAGILDLGGVEKLVQLMNTQESKLDMDSRSMLAYVLASTDKVDCLSRFVHLRGLPVLDSWLQDIRKGKIGNGNIVKDGDKSVEEFLQVLLRALEKIPVNLQALQTCNIGRSVNHLRSHKNVEIQRKARTLVDTWKKRVEAEMTSIDVRSGSTQAESPWPSKSRLQESSHCVSRTPDGAMKSLVTLNSSAKASSGTSSPGESGNKYAASSLGPLKLSPTVASGKESQLRNYGGGSVDTPQVREDRSSTSNQSHNNGYTSIVKDDVNKTSSTSTRNRKNSGLGGTSATVGQKETDLCTNSPAHKSTVSDKSSHLFVTGERAEGPISDGISHKLIVKIPNLVKSPAQGTCGDSMEDPIIMSNQDSLHVQKLKQSNLPSKDKGEASQHNVESDINNYPKDVSEDGQSMVIGWTKRSNDVPTTDNLKSVKLHASSFSPMNALVESCAKYSEATSSFSLDDDDVGMNLLASVAAGEISRSDVSPNDSTERTTPAVEEVCSGVEEKTKSSPTDYSAGVHNQVSSDGCFDKKKVIVDGGLLLDGFSGDKICHPAETILADSTLMKTKSNAEPNHGIDGMVSEDKDITNLGGGDCKLMVGDEVSKAFEERNSSKSLNERFNTSIFHLKPASTVTEPDFVEKASKKDLGQPETGQISLPEASGLVKVGEPSEKAAEFCMIKLETDKGIHCQALSGLASHDLNSQCKMANLENQEIAEHSLPVSQYVESVKQESQKDGLLEKSCTSNSTGKTGKSTPSCSVSASSAHSGGSDSCAKVKFDLNECFTVDDRKHEEPFTLPLSMHAVNYLSSSVSSVPLGHSASITVASASKGTFISPDNLLRTKVELGWKGSAATSAFRPAEPRKVVEMAVAVSNPYCADVSASKHDRCHLDIDLNVPDERLVEEMASRDSTSAVELTDDPTTKCASLLNGAPGSVQQSFGGLDLDLNMADDTNENVQFSSGSNHHRETSFVHFKPVTNLHIQRDFDLNDGPMVDDANVRQFPVNPLVKGGLAVQLPSAGLTISSTQWPNSFTSWFSPGNTYSTVAIPSVLPNRGEQSLPPFHPSAPQRSLCPGGVAQFNPDVYRGLALSSSPAVAFPSGPFQYPVFPFGATFPLPSGTFSVGGTSYQDSSSGARTFPPFNSQYRGPVGNVTPQFQRPFVVGLADVNNSGVTNGNWKWGTQGLDLNAGPGIVEGEVKDESLPHSSGRQSASSFQALAEEQARMFSVSGSVLKRREPDRGWNSEPTGYRHSSWQ